MKDEEDLIQDVLGHIFSLVTGASRGVRGSEMVVSYVDNPNPSNNPDNNYKRLEIDLVDKENPEDTIKTFEKQLRIALSAAASGYNQGIQDRVFEACKDRFLNYAKKKILKKITDQLDGLMAYIARVNPQEKINEKYGALIKIKNTWKLQIEEATQLEDNETLERQIRFTLINFIRLSLQPRNPSITTKQTTSSENIARFLNQKEHNELKKFVLYGHREGEVTSLYL
ncbi:MAG: hypothetical protein V4496_05645, partial [Pseudomonadota bacterium]